MYRTGEKIVVRELSPALPFRLLPRIIGRDLLLRPISGAFSPLGKCAKTLTFAHPFSSRKPHGDMHTGPENSCGMR